MLDSTEQSGLVSSKNSKTNTMKNNIKGASILVTGANGGMGLETVKLLCEAGARRIVLACRTIDKGLETVYKVGPTTTKLEPYGGFDMLSATKISDAVNSLPAEQFDIVFLQSGGMVVADEFQFVPVNGLNIEKTIQQNAIGGLLTLEFLENRFLINDNARIVFAGGEGARGIPKLIKKPDFHTSVELSDYILNASGNYNALDAIGVSKFASALIVQKLAELNQNRSYVWFSPGLTGGTKGLDALKNPKRFLMKHIGFPIMRLLGIAQGPKKAAEKYVQALNSELGKSGELIGAPEGKALGKLVDQKPMNSSLTNHLLIDGLWKFLAETYPAIISNKSIKTT